MPHYTTYGGLYLSAQPIDELTGKADALNETTNFDPKILGPISGEGVFKPQDIDAKGSVIFGDNHFTPDRGGDSLTGEGRSKHVWTNGSATSFEDNLDVGPVNKTSDKGWWTVDGADFRNVESDCPDLDLRSENRFVIERFDQAIGMDSFGESLQPSLQLGTHWSPGGAPAMTGKIGDDSGQMISPLSGGDGCAF